MDQRHANRETSHEGPALIFTFFSTDNIQDIPIFTHRIGFLLMVFSVVCVSAIILGRFRNKGWL